MKPKLVQLAPHKVYEIKLMPFEWNEFIDWIYNNQESDFSINVNGYMFRFKEKNDKDYFAIGFGFAWDCMTNSDMYEKKRKKK